VRPHRVVAVVGALWVLGGLALVFLAGALCTAGQRDHTGRTS
jgi:hypothetical protein